jgi:spoIIIJ-associated protein
VSDALDTRMGEFVRNLGRALGMTLDVEIERIEDGTRVRLAGDGSELFLQRKAAGLDALQHVVNAAFRREHAAGHIVVDCLDYRKGKDGELRESARILAERARDTGEGQEIGPLNPYARRIVHLAVADIPGVSSESMGDAFMKTVLITVSE